MSIAMCSGRMLSALFGRHSQASAVINARVSTGGFDGYRLSAIALYRTEYLRTVQFIHTRPAKFSGQFPKHADYQPLSNRTMRISAAGTYSGMFCKATAPSKLFLTFFIQKIGLYGRFCIKLWKCLSPKCDFMPTPLQRWGFELFCCLCNLITCLPKPAYTGAVLMRETFTSSRSVMVPKIRTGE